MAWARSWPALFLGKKKGSRLALGYCVVICLPHIHDESHAPITIATGGYHLSRVMENKGQVAGTTLCHPQEKVIEMYVWKVGWSTPSLNKKLRIRNINFYARTNDHGNQQKGCKGFGLSPCKTKLNCYILLDCGNTKELKQISVSHTVFFYFMCVTDWLYSHRC